MTSRIDGIRAGNFSWRKFVTCVFRGMGWASYKTCPTFQSGPNTHLGRGRSRGRVIPLLMQLLEMQLTNPASIGLGNCDAVILDLDLFALFREMAQEVSDITTDRTDIGIFYFDVSQVAQLIKAEPASDDKFILVNLAEFGFLHVELVLDIADQFLEHFDGMGQYRDQENGGLKIDSSGSYAFSDGRKTFQDAAELMRLLASEQQTHLCYAKKLAGFALQRDIVATDLPWLGKLAATSSAQGGSVKRVMIELARSDAFRTRLGGAP